MVGELRRKLGPIALAVLLLFMGVGMMDSRVSAELQEFPSAPAALCILEIGTDLSPKLRNGVAQSLPGNRCVIARLYSQMG